MDKNHKGELVGSRTPEQLENDRRFKEAALKQIADSGENWAIHSLAVMKRNALARVLYLNDLYRDIVTVPGVICEFGVQWGASLSVLLNLRNMYEPYNVERFIYGFDTFTGFASVHEKDGAAAKVGDYASVDGYETTLAEILGYHESISAFQHQRKFELIKGDATQTIDTWLDANPGATIALAIFDMDVYAPTKAVLEKIKPRLTSRSVLVFDEFTHQKFPGEVQAVREVFDMRDVEFTRSIHQSHVAIMKFR
ncbi:hypothetical protein ABIB38_000797 [Massilia sp. UYP11]|uniref:class I SAM-dependent methyltransferase n=1 Tax=Massilia sp. UYP11 TaxID=1756385 RepID=UPI003D1BC2BA